MTKASARELQTTGHTFQKNQKAIKLNNVSFGHMCDKKHIFKCLRMIDKEKLPDRGVCALKAEPEHMS